MVLVLRPSTLAAHHPPVPPCVSGVLLCAQNDAGYWWWVHSRYCRPNNQAEVRMNGASTYRAWVSTVQIKLSFAPYGWLALGRA